MEPSDLSEQSRKRLEVLLRGAHEDGPSLLDQLRDLRARDGVPAFSGALRLMANVERSEAEAEALFEELHAHRGALVAALGRDPGLHVAAVDFLSNVKGLLRNPAVVERAELRRAELGAMTDPLTTMFNRRYFRRALEIELRRSRRYVLSLSLLMTDLDYFKSVNDIYGHVLGDRVLERAGRIIRRAVRESDVPCRYGGDEFAVLLPETDRLGALAVAERIRDRVQRYFAGSTIEERLVAMTVSGGLACFPEDGSTSDKLIERADRALYQAKSRGRNTVVIHHAERRREVRFPVKPSTRAELVRGPVAALGAVRPLNLSRGGVLFEANADRLPSGAVELMFWGDEDTWSAAGRVVRVDAGGAIEGGRLVAVAFDRPLPHGHIRRAVEFAPVLAQAEGDRV
jgi:diguanylate cyclase (GGDEF)-like protein